MVSAIVLAGGYATRLRPLSLTKPKALLPILDKPLLDYILDSLEIAGINEVYLSLRVMADKILSHIEGENRKVIPVIEKERLGDAGPLKLISQRYNLSDDVLVIYGDIYNELDIKSLLRFHEKEGCDATIVGKPVEDPRRYGVLITEGERLVQIIEKPKNPVSNLINAGIYVFKKKVLEKIDGQSIAKNFLPKLLSDNTCIAVYKYDGLWMDIGVPSDYIRINLQLLSLKYPKGYINEEAKVSEKVNLIPPYYISSGVNISEDSFIFNSIIGKNTSIGNGVYIDQSILMEDVKVDSFSYIRDSILGDKDNLGKWVRLDSVILGDEVVIYDGVFVNRDTIILPYKEVNESVYDKGKIIL
ncbi:nucleotidyltransferase family protein [Sulfurisphaera ohwakuensis]|uniref:Mannose-1-phosphate guanylyltransferase n=1 Tax=Sulfurisphaera ohwakuensis TaxID=69656 RepID=A0A650CKB7_SULOH|nr:NDP-sugar synthase [Sulfurisphaera ohwakuensis]MBB5253849.1 mannose-1-phosphate guanylyltransferase [Sulfurisphaera ohwakuensis]QGR17917.1 NTP transferase domain-containing protein [Sulfurisphaera ohwakuensis]